MNTVCYCLQVNLANYMRTLIFDIMQAVYMHFIIEARDQNDK